MTVRSTTLRRSTRCPGRRHGRSRCIGAWIADLRVERGTARTVGGRPSPQIDAWRRSRPGGSWRGRLGRSIRAAVARRSWRTASSPGSSCCALNVVGSTSAKTAVRPGVDLVGVVVAAGGYLRRMAPSSGSYAVVVLLPFGAGWLVTFLRSVGRSIDDGDRRRVELSVVRSRSTAAIAVDGDEERRRRSRPRPSQDGDASARPLGAPNSKTISWPSIGRRALPGERAALEDSRSRSSRSASGGSRATSGVTVPRSFGGLAADDTARRARSRSSARTGRRRTPRRGSRP